MLNGLLLGDDDKVANWAFSTFGFYPTRVDRALGIIDSNKALVGAILFQNYNGTNVELSYYGPHTLTPGIVKAIAKVAIVEFNAARVTAVTSKKNKRLMRVLQRFGFKLEGAQRRYYGHRDCARHVGVRFVMFREEIDKIARINTILPEQNKV